MLFTFLNSKHQVPFPISRNYCYTGIVSSHYFVAIQLHNPLGQVAALVRHGKMGGSGQVRIRSIGLQVKLVILSGLKRGSGRLGCGLGRVDLYFSHNFFFFNKKTTYICYLESHAINYLMKNTLLWIHHLYQE